VYDFETLLLSGAIALIVGIVLGVLFTRLLSADSRKQRDLERSVDRLLQQQKDYQHQVVEHFTDTAALLNNLAESYRDVHNHLAKGATALCDDESGSILRPIPETPIAQITGEPDLASVQPPRDYAPKASPYATGVLNEEFGLDKSKQPPTAATRVVEQQAVKTAKTKPVAGSERESDTDKGSKEESKKTPEEQPTLESDSAEGQEAPIADEEAAVVREKTPEAKKKAPPEKENASAA
jgi:uncharacterized membrane-anchored protein YhcB (DUF1043 family)